MSREPWLTVSIILLSLLLSGIVLMKIIYWANDPREGLLRDIWGKLQDGDLWVISSLNAYCWTLTGFFIWEHGKLLITAYFVTVASILCLSGLVKRNLRSPLSMVIKFHTLVLWRFFPAIILGPWEIIEGILEVILRRVRRRKHTFQHPTLPIRRVPSR